MYTYIKYRECLYNNLLVPDDNIAVGSPLDIEYCWKQIQLTSARSYLSRDLDFSHLPTTILYTQ